MKVIIVVIVIVIGVSMRVWIWRHRRQPKIDLNIRAVPRRSFLELMFGNIGLVARREVRERIRGKTFQVGTLLILLAVAAAIVIPVLTKSNSHPTRIGVVGVMSTPLEKTLNATAASTGTTITILSEPNKQIADKQLRSGNLDVVLLQTQELIVNKPISNTDFSSPAQFVRYTSAVLGVERAYIEAGLSANQTRIVSRAKPLEITSLQPASTKGPVHTTSLILLILTFVMLSQYNTWTLIGVMEEKSSRVVEVILAVVRPRQLLSGKVLGIGLVAFFQAALTLAFALGLTHLVGSDLLRGTNMQAFLSSLLWLILGYSFYSWVYAAAGSMAKRQEQVQTLALPLTLPLILGYVTSLFAATSGDASMFFKILAYLPPTAPFAMPVLVGIGKAAWWQFTLSGVIAILSTVLVAKMATEIYRRSILNI